MDYKEPDVWESILGKTKGNPFYISNHGPGGENRCFECVNTVNACSTYNQANMYSEGEDTEDPFNLGIQSILKKPIKELTHLLKEMAISKDKEANKLVEKNEASKVEGPYKLIGASSVEKVDEKKGVKRPLGDGLKKGKSKRRKERRAREKKLEELRLENKRQKTPQLVENDIQLTKSIVPRKCRIKRYSFKYDTF